MVDAADLAENGEVATAKVALEVFRDVVDHRDDVIPVFYAKTEYSLYA
jgi:hypothetical protein